MNLRLKGWPLEAAFDANKTLEILLYSLFNIVYKRCIEI